MQIHPLEINSGDRPFESVQKRTVQVREDKAHLTGTKTGQQQCPYGPW